ncbi:MAG: GGDEF domain-containing protein [Planctomycetota bacterium]
MPREEARLAFGGDIDPVPSDSVDAGDDSADAATPAPAGEDDRDGPPHRPTVLILNHHRDPLDELVAALGQRGMEVIESRSVAETHRTLGDRRPDVVVLNPLVLRAGGVEIELARGLCSNQDGSTVLLLVDGLRGLEQARRAALPFADFLQKPVDPAECLHRIELAFERRERFHRLRSRAQELEGQVTIDHKTGLSSERFFRSALQLEFKRAQRHRMPLSLALVDVDDFKSINDSTEYAFGDIVLQHIADCLKRNIRETDYAARFGGDEFVLLLPHTTSAEAVQTAMRIKKRIAESVVTGRGYSQKVTISIGIATFDGHSDFDSAELRTRANKALHRAKRRGKNHVECHGDEPPAAPPPPTKKR